MFYFIASISFGLIAFVVFIILRLSKKRLSALLVKAFTSWCFIFTAGAGIMENVGAARYGLPLLLGLVLGLLGDIWLDLKWIYEKESKMFLWWGFSCFLAAHVFCIIAIISKSKMELSDIFICVAISIAISVINLLIAKPMKLDMYGHRIIVFLYVVALALSSSTAVFAMIRNGFTRPWVLLAVGLILFFLSDAILSQTYYGKDKDGNFYVFINHLLYYFGQFLIASSIFFM